MDKMQNWVPPMSQIHPIEDERGLEVIGAIYDIENGHVEFL